PGISTLSLHDALPIWLRGSQAKDFTRCLFGDDDVFLGVTLLFAAIVFTTIFAVLRATDRPVRAVDDERQLGTVLHERFAGMALRSEEHTSELQSLAYL